MNNERRWLHAAEVNKQGMPGIRGAHLVQYFFSGLDMAKYHGGRYLQDSEIVGSVSANFGIPAEGVQVYVVEGHRHIRISSEANDAIEKRYVARPEENAGSDVLAIADASLQPYLDLGFSRAGAEVEYLHNEAAKRISSMSTQEQVDYNLVIARIFNGPGGP